MPGPLSETVMDTAPVSDTDDFTCICGEGTSAHASMAFFMLLKPFLFVNNKRIIIGVKSFKNITSTYLYALTSKKVHKIN